jgi:hypothetical protein
MESTVTRELVFVPTKWTQLEFGHRRVRAFEWHRIDHRVSWAALSAACKRIPVAAVGAVCYLAIAIGTKRAIMWHWRD